MVAGDGECRDDEAAIPLKLAAIAAILVASIAGVAIPLAGRRRPFLLPDGGGFLFVKAFGAGLILATGFVHMLPEAAESLADAAMSARAWPEFPFAGFAAIYGGRPRYVRAGLRRNDVLRAGARNGGGEAGGEGLGPVPGEWRVR